MGTTKKLQNRKIGFHMSAAGGVYKAVEKAAEINTTAVQLFLKNNNRWSAKEYTENDIKKFKKAHENYSMPVYAHSGYLINPAGKGENRQKSLAALFDEIERAHLLGINHLVLHPGNHLGAGIDKGIQFAAQFLDEVFNESPWKDVIICLETTSGQGTSIGHSFENIKDIIKAGRYPERLQVCLDTCHIFAAGYDFSTEEKYARLISDFDEIIGLPLLSIIHFNDSKKDLGTKIDRHENIGEGLIGQKALSFFLNDERLKDIPFIMETPKEKGNEKESDLKNLKTVLSMIKDTGHHA